MFVLFLYIYLYIRCISSISINKKPFASHWLINPIDSRTHSSTKLTDSFTNCVPRTWEDVPVFMISVGGRKIFRDDERIYTYFMDFAAVQCVLADQYFSGNLEKQIFYDIQTVSLKDWFQLVDPKVERIKGHSNPLLKPSSHQNYKILYKLKKKGNQDPIPLYYSDHLSASPGNQFSILNSFKVDSTKNNSNNTPNKPNDSKNDLNRVYFFDYDDLLKEIGKLSGKIEREKALKSIKIVSLMDVLMAHENERDRLLFVPSSKNLNLIDKMKKHTTPWITP